VALATRRAGRLASPIQDAAIAAGGHQAVLLGGLTAGDTSADAITRVRWSGSRAAGVLPGGLHDSAAVWLSGAAYLFGGGNGARQLDQILRIDAARGRARLVGRLPAPSSDQAAAAIGGTAYVVGGYTGTRWLNTIVAWRPGSGARIVAHLPSPLRYAAVTAADGRLVIAGGSLPSGGASSAVLEYTPSSGRLLRLGRLPAPTTHAAAASIGGIAYVIGGRGALLGTPTRRIVAVDPLTTRVRPAGRLRTPLSDAAATALGGRILVAGGRSGGRTEASLLQLTPRTAAGSQGRASSQPLNVYAADKANRTTGAARHARAYVYVPNSDSNTVDVIDPQTYRVVRQFSVGALPQHVVPAYNLKTLYVTNDLGNSLTPIDPRTGRPGRSIAVDDPYNMYFTPDGRYAIVVAERLGRLDFRLPHSFRLHHALRVPCRGVDHLDFSAGGRYLLASCEFSRQLLKVDVRREKVVGLLTLPAGRGGIPQDVKLSPDGKVFYVADMTANGLWLVDGDHMRVVGFVHTGTGVHGLYPSRDAKYLYATNRGEGSISVISFKTRKMVAKWRIPGGGSPDMGNVSANGKVLWLSGRYDSVVYAISTRNGRLLAKIPVGAGPHGLCVWPQPGRYSLGHTGILR
jgi:YVTN family beta-propeller protein